MVQDLGYGRGFEGWTCRQGTVEGRDRVLSPRSDRLRFGQILRQLNGDEEASSPKKTKKDWRELTIYFCEFGLEDTLV